MELTRRDVLAALAAVLYPSEVTGIEEFVREYSLARVTGRPGYREGMAAALGTLDRQAKAFHGASFAALAPAERDEVLRGLAVDEADPDPDGEPRQRVRYYLVNELLFALYTTPTGGELVGIENPPGHPGGTASYRVPPQS